MLNDVITLAYAKETELRERGSLGKASSEAKGLYMGDRVKTAKRDNHYSKNTSKSKGRSYSTLKLNKNGKWCFICEKEGC